MNPTRSSASSWQIVIRWVAIGCLLLGIGLRLWAIDHNILWHDEVLTAVSAAGHRLPVLQAREFANKLVMQPELAAYLGPKGQPWHTVFASVIGNPEHPPLYYLLTRFWMECFGSSAFALRSLPTIFGLAVFPALYWVCWELTRSPLVGWVAMALVALSPFHVLYGREAREYSLWAALLLVLGALLLRALRLTEQAATWGDRVRAWWPYSLVLALGLYTSLLTVYVSVGQGLYVLWLDRGRLGWRVRSLVLAGLAGGLLFLPWALVLLNHWEAARQLTAWMTAYEEPRIQVLRRLVIQTLRGFTDWVPVGAGWWGAGLFCAIALGSLIWIQRRLPRWVSGWVLSFTLVSTSLLVIPDLLDGGLRSISTRYWTPTYLGLQIAFAILIVQGLTHGPTLRRSLAAIGASLLLTISLNGSWQLITATTNWAKGISVSLPAFAEQINAAANPLVIADGFGYRAGNTIALALRLRPNVPFYLVSDFRQVNPGDLQLLKTAIGQMTPPVSDLYVLNLMPPFREAIETELKGQIQPLGGDNMAWLDRLQLPSPIAAQKPIPLNSNPGQLQPQQKRQGV